MKDLNQLGRKLNYKFKNAKLLKQALTHCSLGSENNERLEFLGDSILNMVISEALYLKFPQEYEGQLSRLRAVLVKGETLAKIAFELDLGEYLYLGQGELKSGGFRRSSILADALEAIFAAIFLDGGITACKSTILFLYESRLNADKLLHNLKDSKTKLQEHLQSKRLPLPQYNLIKANEDSENPVFYVSCSIPESTHETTGKGRNRRKAEQEAAKFMLDILGSADN